MLQNLPETSNINRQTFWLELELECEEGCQVVGPQCGEYTCHTTTSYQTACQTRVTKAPPSVWTVGRLSQSQLIFHSHSTVGDLNLSGDKHVLSCHSLLSRLCKTLK